MVDREFIGKSVEDQRWFFALYGSWEALGGCKILPQGAASAAQTLPSTHAGGQDGGS